MTCQSCRGSGEIPVPFAHPNRPQTSACKCCGGTGELREGSICKTCGQAISYDGNFWQHSPQVPPMGHTAQPRLDADERAKSEAEREYIDRCCAGIGTNALVAIDAAAWCFAHPPKQVDKAQCVHSWFYSDKDKFRCTHCGITLELRTTTDSQS